MQDGIDRIKFDLPFEYTRAIRSRAGITGVYPRDVVMAALDAYLVKEIAEAKEWLSRQGPGSGEAPSKPKKKDRPSA